MSTAMEKSSLVQILIEEVSDVDLVCYLAHCGGSPVLKDLFECVRDADGLSIEALVYNIDLVRKKKEEARGSPLLRVFQRLMRSGTHAVSSMPSASAEVRLH